VQADEIKGTYCGTFGTKVNALWGGKPALLARYHVPYDKAKDYLLVGLPGGKGANRGKGGDKGGGRFKPIQMQHSRPGCGALVERFGDDGKSLILDQGGTSHPGRNLLLEW